MKQIELLPKRAKAKFCNWMHPDNVGWWRCDKPAVIQIRQAFYCVEHAETAQKMFGPGQPV